MTAADRPPVSGEPSDTETDALTLAIHLHYCEDKPFGYCGLTEAHRQLALRLIELKPVIEARATPPALIENIVTYMENEGVVTWGDEGHRARFLDWMKEPTNGD